MDNPAWLKQSKDKPLYEDLLWSRPENKNRAGKLLIIGGNVHGFAAPAQSYTLAQKAGAGAVKVLLPDSLKSSVGAFIPDTVFCPSNKIGSFNQESISEFLDYATWADLCLLCGDFGRNSETAILIESFADKFKGKLTITKDALSFFLNSPLVLERPDTLLVTNLSELQKILKSAHYPQAMTSTMPLANRVEFLSELTKTYPISIVTYHDSIILAADKGRVSTTQIDSQEKLWELAAACYSSVWWAQNNERPFEAITTSILDLPSD